MVARRAPKPCAAPGCGTLVEGRERYCLAHAHRAKDRQRQQVRQHNTRRRSGDGSGSDAFYWSTAWRRLRERILAQHPLCAIHQEKGMVVEATVVDHIIPRRERPDLALEPSNLRALCHDCHNRFGQKVRHGS